MNDFVAGLVARAAGLAPVAAPRSTPPPTALDFEPEPADAGGDAVAPLAAGPSSPPALPQAPAVSKREPSPRDAPRREPVVHDERRPEPVPRIAPAREETAPLRPQPPAGDAPDERTVTPVVAVERTVVVERVSAAAPPAAPADEPEPARARDVTSPAATALLPPAAEPVVSSPARTIPSPPRRAAPTMEETTPSRSASAPEPPSVQPAPAAPPTAEGPAPPPPAREPAPVVVALAPQPTRAARPVVIEREPTIEVRIGRVEVRSPPQPTDVAAAAAPPPAPARGLDDLALARRHLDRTWY